MMKHDLKWFMTELNKVCNKHLTEEDPSKEAMHNTSSVSLDVEDDSCPVKDPSQLWFSILNEEVEGYYLELKEIANV